MKVEATWRGPGRLELPLASGKIGRRPSALTPDLQYTERDELSMPNKRTAPSQQPEYARVYRRQRYEITGNAFIKDWRERNPEKKREYNARWYQNHPEKRKAHDAVHSAVVRGIIRPARDFHCVDCGLPAHEYDHHLGYEPEHWLNVQPVCRKCHGKRRWKG